MKKIFCSDDHIPSFDGGRAVSEIKKSTVRPLYVYRPVVNTADLTAWAKSQGFKSIVAPTELHVTVIYSKAPVDWFKLGESYSGNDKGEVTVLPGGPRAIETFGEGAVVLCFASDTLAWRNQIATECYGASWDYESYQPHITITYDPGDVDLSKVEPYAGKIVLGPECFEDIDSEWKDKVSEVKDVHVIAKVLDVNQDEGIVYGWAIVNSVNGEPYFDLNVDTKTGERVPEHVTEAAMHKAALPFALSARAGNDMHEGPDLGVYPYIMPLSDAVAKAFGITCDKRGLMVGFKPPADILAKYQSKEYTGFSIQGGRVKYEEVTDA